MAEEPLGRRATIELLERHGVTPAKRLGQHFLVDPNTTRKIVAVAGVEPGTRVLEIGAGAGTLTRALAAAGATVIAYEVDDRLAPVLETALAGLASVEVRFEDATTAGLASVATGTPWMLVANLPYNVGTPLVLDLLRTAPAIGRFVVMLQREAVDRLVALPGSRTYGLPSVVVGLHGSPAVRMRVPPSVFHPPPQVESAVVVIDRAPAPARAERAIGLAAAGFGQRRKMLRSALAGVLGEPVAVLERAGVDPTARAEGVSPQDWLRVAEVADAL